jgi:serine/threonine protein kinase
MNERDSLLGDEVVGRGGSSIVKMKRHRKTGARIAVKSINRENFDEPDFLGEVEALTKLNHPCIVRIVGWCPPVGLTLAEIWTQYAGRKSLAKVLAQTAKGDRPSFWTPTGKAIIICGIVLGMKFVHDRGFIHGDLKPGNILLNGRGQALINGFGTCCESAASDATADAAESPKAGTIRYAAPELFREDLAHRPTSDVFSFGSLLYEILGETPVFGPSDWPLGIRERLVKGEMPPTCPTWGILMQDLIRRCWSLDPDERPGFAMIIKEFEYAGFVIVPGANEQRVRDFVQGVLQWEGRSLYR